MLYLKFSLDSVLHVTHYFKRSVVCDVLPFCHRNCNRIWFIKLKLNYNTSYIILRKKATRGNVFVFILLKQICHLFYYKKLFGKVDFNILCHTE